MKKYSFYIILFAALCSMQACKKELNALPENSRVAEVAITDPKSAETSLNGVYYAFANATPTNTNWRNHERYPGMLAGYLGYGYGGAFEEENNRNSGAGEVYWSESYKLLNAANGLLEGMEKLSAESFTGNRKKEIIAEAHFLRAYGHFKLLNYYGEWFKPNSALGVLIRDKSSTKSNISKARSSVQESYAFILADLEDAITNGPSSRPNHYATKWAAMVLKMRVLMMRGATADFTQVISIADNIIQNSGHQLETNTKDIFYTKGLTSKEVIMGLKPQGNQHLDFYSRSKQYWPGASGLYVAVPGLKNLLQNDPRYSWYIGTSNAYRANTNFFLKYIAQSTVPTQVSETYYAMRLSEVYLLKSEAIVRSGGSLATARTVAKEVMTRAGVTDFTAIDNASTASEMLIQLYYETARSLVAEDGQEWMSLLRLDFDTVKQLRPTIISTEQYIFPIPHSEFVYNPEIGDQNPGYDR